MVIAISFLIVIVSLFLPVDKINSETFINYYPLFVPCVIAGIVSLGNSSINSISLEKNNIEVLYTLPMKIEKVLYYKWLANVVICSLIVLVDATVINLLFKPDVFTIIASYIFPIVVIKFVSLLSLVLDYRFVVKKEYDDGIILKQRYITLVPSLISLVIVFIPLVLKTYILYKYIICSFGILCIFGMLVCEIYLLVNRKKLRRNLIK